MLTRRKVKLAAAQKRASVKDSTKYCDGTCGKPVSQKSTKPTHNTKIASTAELGEGTHAAAPDPDLDESTAEHTVGLPDLFEENPTQAEAAPVNPLITMNADELAKILSDHTKQLSEHWD